MRAKSPVPDRLVDLAMTVIEREGEAAVRIREICDAAGVAVTAVYNHFGNRDGLIVEAQSRRYIRIVEAETDWFVARIRLCRTPDDLPAVVDDLLDRIGSPDRVQARLLRIGVVGSSIGRPELIQRITESTSRLIGKQASALRELQSQGLLPSDLDIDALCMWYFGLLTSRSFLESSPEIASLESWDRLTRVALYAILFDTKPNHP